MPDTLQLPIIDLASSDKTLAVDSIRQACTEYGFFYVVNHGVEKGLSEEMFAQSRKFFLLPVEEKMKLARKKHRGYTALCQEKLDPLSSPKGDLKESFYIGPLEEDLNQWPDRDILPVWREVMESYYTQVLHAGRKLLSLIALSLHLDEHYFEKIGALDPELAFLRLLYYPGFDGELSTSSEEEVYGASAHSDYGMITLLATDGTPGLQVCRQKESQPLLWEDVRHFDGALVVNIGDMLERWTNCRYRSTLHRVMPAGKERFSAAMFLDPREDCVVECIESCCSESSPPRYPPIRSGDYLRERLRITYENEYEYDG